MICQVITTAAVSTNRRPGRKWVGPTGEHTEFSLTRPSARSQLTGPGSGTPSVPLSGSNAQPVRDADHNPIVSINLRREMLCKSLAETSRERFGQNSRLTVLIALVAVSDVVWSRLQLVCLRT
jgi:hypothetical protein